jgi:hypothetical protein
MAKKVAAKESVAAPRQKPSALVDTRVVYCGDNLEQLAKLPAACIDLIYIDPPFNSNRNYKVFWGESGMNRLALFLCVLCIFCYGCSTYQPPTQPTESEKAMQELDASVKSEMERLRPENIAAEAKRRRDDYVNAHPELQQQTRDDILSGKFRIGMTAEQVQASCGKPPHGVNSTVTAYGKFEQWVYDSNYLYFENGILISFQKFQQ